VIAREHSDRGNLIIKVSFLFFFLVFIEAVRQLIICHCDGKLKELDCGNLRASSLSDSEIPSVSAMFIASYGRIKFV
ncbi:hypothetical protein KAU33_06835, partial [Candidatus Dependentiae bacterium]|nr:hypothetical protein [Candidatus Dependentiae bacterium]